MARTKSTQPPAPGNRTSPLFQARKQAERNAALTHERIAEHLDAFRKAGGTIEVLGTTRALQRIGLPEDAATSAPPAAPVGRARKPSR